MEISVLSEVDSGEDEDFVSTAKVEISRIQFLGTTTGGASSCVPVPDGYFAKAGSEQTRYQI